MGVSSPLRLELSPESESVDDSGKLSDDIIVVMLISTLQVDSFKWMSFVSRNQEILRSANPGFL